MRIAGRMRDAVAAAAARTIDDDEAAALFATASWSCLVEPGDGVAGRLVAALGAAEALETVRAASARPPDGIEITARGWKEALGRWRPRLGAGTVVAALEAAARGGARLLTPGHPNWPDALGDLGDHAPLCLWVRGEAALLSVPAVAIIGARAATSYGEHVAMELAAELAGRGLSIVSGAAYGIDGAAHRAALAAGGPTAALLAGGVERAYPVGHTNLLDRIAAAGVVVSEVPCGGAPTRWRFLQRNRLIAALSLATIVVEAGSRSGSLNTASHAATLARPLGAVPGPITSAASSGCHRMLREFDARCITGADDVLELLGVVADPTARGRTFPADRPPTDDVSRVIDALSARSSRSADDIARRSGMSVADVEAILGVLALEGAAEFNDGGWRHRPAARK